MYKRLPLVGILIPFQSFAQMSSRNEAGMYLMNMASGTSMNRESAPMPMRIVPAGSWTLMVMGQAFIVDTQQSGPRGGDKLYSSNAFMFNASHTFAGGTLQFQSMISLEPLTIADRRYPKLFQTIPWGAMDSWAGRFSVTPSQLDHAGVVGKDYAPGIAFAWRCHPHYRIPVL
jgi:hypothetical protein